MMLGRTAFFGVVVALAAMIGCADKGAPSKKADKKDKDDTNIPAEGDSKSGSNVPAPGEADTNAPSSPVSPTSPKLDAMDPSSVPASAAEGTTIDVTLSGSQFASDAQVSIGSENVKPLSASSTQIRVRLPAIVLSRAGAVPVKVLNPPSAGGPSNALSFTVTTASAQIALSNIDPSTAIAGATTSLTLDVTGSGFTMNSRVRFNGSDVKTVFGSSKSLTATIPSGMLKLAGRVSVTVFDGSTVSTPKTFTISKAASTSACDYSCTEYGYSNGQCYQDWTCKSNGCLEQQACTASTSSCQYKCADYGYAKGQCYEDWTCQSNGCLTAQSCGGGSAATCDYLCSDYGYGADECADGWCCVDGCLEDESQYYP